MYAVVKSGGHQYRLRWAIGSLSIGSWLTRAARSVWGRCFCTRMARAALAELPICTTLRCGVKVVKHSRHPKVIVFKYKRRKNYKRTKGWKQPCSEVEITSIGKASGS